MRSIFTLFAALMLVVQSHAIILLPGKVEEPNRADKIIAEKFKLKKAFLDQHRKRIKQKFATLKNAPTNVAATPLAAPAPLREEANMRSKGVATDGTMVPDQGKTLQE